LKNAQVCPDAEWSFRLVLKWGYIYLGSNNGYFSALYLFGCRIHDENQIDKDPILRNKNYKWSR